MSSADSPRTVTAAEIARSVDIGPKTFREALRRANLRWHAHYEKWEVPFGSDEHHEMIAVLASLTQSQKPTVSVRARGVIFGGDLGAAGGGACPTTSSFDLGGHRAHR